MPGAMHRMGVYLGLVEDEDYADGDPAYDGYGAERYSARREEYSDARQVREPHRVRGTDVAHSRSYTDEVEQYANGHYPVGEQVHGGYADDRPTYQITALHPRTYNEARTIGEHFRNNTPVIMNLSEMDDADAKRLVDFAAGLIFGLHGSIDRVTTKVFLLTPHNVTVTAQDKARMAESGFFNQS